MKMEYEGNQFLMAKGPNPRCASMRFGIVKDWSSSSPLHAQCDLGIFGITGFAGRNFKRFNLSYELLLDRHRNVNPCAQLC